MKDVDRPMSAYRAVALALAVTFAGVGIVFFVAPGAVATLFERASRLPMLSSLPPGRVEPELFRVLSAAYMYVVAWLAWMMFRRPDDAAWPGVLAQAKFASAAFSFVLAAVHGPSLVLASNGVVDALLGLLALQLRRSVLARGSRHAVAGP